MPLRALGPTGPPSSPLPKNDNIRRAINKAKQNADEVINTATLKLLNLNIL